MEIVTANITGKKVVFNAIFVLLSAVIAGIAGILTAVLMFWMTRQKIAQDDYQKHGISERPASRLGGLAVAFCALAVYFMYSSFQVDLKSVSGGLLASPIFYAVLIGMIGFCDDCIGHMSARARLLLTSIIFAACLMLNLEIVPSAIGIPGFDSLLQFKALAFFLCLLTCLTLLNATNMADGANGLMPLVFMGTFYAYAILTGELAYFSIAIGLMVFTLFNVLSGRLFLGDVGSYGLGALAGLGAIKIVGETEAVVWLFLCLAAYPVVDFFVSLTRRMSAGKSVFLPDNDHMHNLLYAFLRKFTASSLIANSVSGLSISCLTTGTALIALSFWELDSSYWIVLFGFFVLLYFVAYKLLKEINLRSD